MSQRSHNKVVVTGGAGFIGSHLVDRLITLNPAATVVVVDNFSSGQQANIARHLQESRLRLIEADVRDAAAVDESLAGAEVVYHLASQSQVISDLREVNETFTTNVVGTVNVLRAAAKHAVKRVVFASSREVYGEPITLPVDEDHPLLPINSYGASVLAAEVYCRTLRRVFGLQTAILRLTNVYGPRDAGHVIPIWLERAAAGHDLLVYGGRQTLDFIWIGDAVEALITAGTSDAVNPPINVASGTGIRAIDLARRIKRLTACSGRIEVLPPRAFEVSRFVGNVSRMAQMLNIQPQLDPLIHLPTMIEAAHRPGPHPQETRSPAVNGLLSPAAG
jgi:UDP-glucose 4-epimerase